jgi:hypothetical protein
MRWLCTLNHYATLISAGATVVYVTLTYTMLRVLRRESMRDQRLRHLADIKRKVITPIKQWLDNVVVPGLTGQSLMVSVREVQRPRTYIRLGEPNMQTFRELGCDLRAPEAIKNPLFLHAKDEHFPDELELVQVSMAKLEPLLSGLRQFANECADEIAEATSLQRNYPAAAGSAEFANSDFLTALYMKHFLARNEPSFEESPKAADGMELTVDSGATVVARGASGDVRSWQGSAQGLLFERWQKSDLGKLALEAIDQALHASAKLNELQFTYELKGDCRYLGAPGPSRIKVGLRSLRRWLKRA